MSETTWNIVIAIKLKGNDFNIALTAGEQSILTLLRASYGIFETQVKDLADQPATKRPVGLIDDALILLRCLVFNKLQNHQGQYVNIRRV